MRASSETHSAAARSVGLAAPGHGQHGSVNDLCPPGALQTQQYRQESEVGRGLLHALLSFMNAMVGCRCSG